MGSLRTRVALALALTAIGGLGAPMTAVAITPAGDGRVDALTARIDRLEHRLAAAKAENARLKRVAVRQARQLAPRARSIKAATRTLKVRLGGSGNVLARVDRLLASRRAASTERDAARSALATAGAERDAAIGERDAARDARDTAISARDTAVAAHGAAVSQRDAARAERDAGLAALSAAQALLGTSDVPQGITDLLGTVDTLEASVADLTDEIDAAEVQLGGTGTLVQRAQALRNLTDPAAPDVASGLASVRAIVGGNPALTLRDAVTAISNALDVNTPISVAVSDVNTWLGGVGSTRDRIASIDALVGGSPPLGTVNGFDVGVFDAAAAIRDRIGAFLTVLNQSPGVATSRIELPSSAGYDSLRAVLAQLGHD